MEHAEIEQTRVTEKYLLGELEPDARERLEEHVFECPECALDLRAAATFLECSKTILAQPEPEAKPAPEPVRPGWLSWLRPAIAAPLMAAMAAVIVYLAIPSRPGARPDSPQILASVALAGSTRGGSQPLITLPREAGFVAFVDIPADPNAKSYQAELWNPGKALEWTLPVSAEAAKDTLALRIPAPRGGTGTYSLVVRGVKPDGQLVEAARYPFEVRFQ